MTLLRALFIVPELAPLTGNTTRAKEHHFLSRAIADFGVDVTVAVPGCHVQDSTSHGLARRLTPLTVSDNSGRETDVTVLEGSAAGGRVSVLVIEQPALKADGDSAHDERFVRAVQAILDERDAAPQVIFVAHGSERFLPHLNPSPGDEFVKLFLLREQAPSAAWLDALPHADRIVVSSTHGAQAVRANIERGRRDPLSRHLQPLQNRLYGIPSGIDVVEWNPHQDGLLDQDFPRDPRAGKAVHKARLRRSLHLGASGADTPLVAVVGPIDENILTYGAANELAQFPVQIVVVADLNTDADSLKYLRRLANQVPTRIAIKAFTDHEARRRFVHDVLAAADFALFAREFSPSSLGELYCMPYGAIPIAPRVGTYADLLVEFDSLTQTGSGFLFEPYEHDRLLDAIQRAINAYAHHESFGRLIERALTIDLSWRTTAQRYVNLIVDVIRQRQSAADLAS